ncbi:GCN5-like N-acetyltransferase [Thermoclostridium stercorarium subsp. stercorarium DSM 8532]|uniref:GCN5-like N-acetyltransferase n=3 Tax=Thermoclostridium stercorarium TaxID=1510 RepID=L7VM00_THES1|nr:GNAT family N-acetyltransferase [Thermoclostridium stercorarium]AGC69230.1 GCN5-like N-acetyltransferase [Thermoclostridium stercorarium subsp. stercorarium DSM 8532]AGI40201.1 acetyltransferase [Thermoclostridium stercorarium subsp. stercorarium DSM 8532]ANW99504.1 GCN5 family acetyltransferase [Thermoclostridium stercorarium subsp. thermolacticum DSM 2910]ANX02131.1 GCN5 family acetyltransferase [Thermoclostridium stercorarium subsp. leptospartum DSM 9219]
MENCFVLRHAVVSDAAEIHVLLQEAFREYAEFIGVTQLEALNESIKDVEYEIKNNTVFVAIADGCIIGTIRVRISGDEAYISRLAVSKPHRNMGVGESLINLVDRFLQSKGVKKAILYTASNNPNLVRFYYGRGFYIDSVSHERGYPRARMIKEYRNIDTDEELCSCHNSQINSFR